MVAVGQGDDRRAAGLVSRHAGELPRRRAHPDSGDRAHRDHQGSRVRPVWRELESIGGEAQLSVQARDVSAYANYSYQKRTYSEELPFANAGRTTFTSDASLYPSHMAKLGITYRIPVAYLQATVEGRYIGARIASDRNNELVYGDRSVSTQQYQLDSYVLLDAVVSSHNLKLWNDRETRITGKVYNLLGTDYAFPGYRGFDIPGFVRSYMISFSQQF